MPCKIGSFFRREVQGGQISGGVLASGGHKVRFGKLRSDFGGGRAELVPMRENDAVALLREVAERAFKLIGLEIFLFRHRRSQIFLNT